MLIGSEGLVNILSKQVAMTEGCPGSAIIRVMGDQLSVILDGLRVVATSCTKLCHFAQGGNRRYVPFCVLRLLLLLLDL